MHRLLVWTPYRRWKVRLSCPQCKGQLTGAGVHRRAREVLDVDRYYLMGPETLRCISPGWVTTCQFNLPVNSDTSTCPHPVATGVLTHTH